MTTIAFLAAIFLLVLVAAIGVHRLNGPGGRRAPVDRHETNTGTQRHNTLSRRERAYVDWFTRQDA